jgi:hypothetical protein
MAYDPEGFHENMSHFLFSTREIDVTVAAIMGWVLLGWWIRVGQEKFYIWRMTRKDKKNARD